MRPRTIALVGAAIVAAGLILRQLIMAGSAAAAWASGTQLDQSLLGALLTLGDVVAQVSVPLGAAVLGGGIVLLLAGRTAPAADAAGDAGTREPEWTPPTDSR